jgi:hypothetical protein
MTFGSSGQNLSGMGQNTAAHYMPRQPNNYGLSAVNGMSMSAASSVTDLNQSINETYSQLSNAGSPKANPQANLQQ